MILRLCTLDTDLVGHRYGELTADPIGSFLKSNVYRVRAFRNSNLVLAIFFFLSSSITTDAGARILLRLSRITTSRCVFSLKETRGIFQYSRSTVVVLILSS